MKVIDFIQAQRPSLSFEFFPPKSDVGFWDLAQTIHSLKPLDPTYVSVTYGAGGSTRKKTVDLVTRIKNDMGIEPVAHLTCVGATRDEVAEVIDELWNANIRNILALRGDPPHGSGPFTPTPGGFAHAAELVAFIRSRHEGICVAGACHPEKHPEASNLDSDITHLKSKVDAGCDYLVTQLFFDNTDFYRFRDKAVAAGIGVPVIVGIMPIRSVKQIKRFADMCGATIPRDLLGSIEAVEDDPAAVQQVGAMHALKQCEDLIAEGVAGLHFYTLNKSTATRAIFQQIKDRLRHADMPQDASSRG
jgi:methylenetetrahydrofolate reductase (NADPH)